MNAAKLIEEWIDTDGHADLRTTCGLDCRIEFIAYAIEAIQDPVSPVKWQQKPEKEPKLKKIPQSAGNTVPPGTNQYADQGNTYQGVA